MDETNCATGGSERTNLRQPAPKLRLASLVLIALLGSALVLWISHVTWVRMDRLQREFATLRPESFYLGVRMKGDIRQLNDTLLRYRLRGEDTDYALFRAEAGDLSVWFESNRTNASTRLERQFFERMGKAYREYLADSTNLLNARIGFFQTKAGAFPGSYEKVQAQSQHLLDLCDEFIQDQRSAFNHFVQESTGALTNFQHLLELLATLMVVLITALAVLVYRGMIAPLRLQLTTTQALIVRQEKLASLGALAAGVAHEIRNPLTAIKFRLYSLKKSLPAELAENEDAAVIGDEILRLERIVKDFLLFARPSEPELVAVPAQRILQEVSDLLKPQLKKAEIELKLEAADAAWVRADTQQLKQVLINLIQNSADSVGRGGVIALRTNGKTGPSVVLEVADNGKGIPPDVQARLFDPFFTTKEGGTGLGLPIAARIVEKHGGELRYQTQLNRGTTFSIILPRLVQHETENSAD